MSDDGGKTEQVDCFWCGSVYELQDDHDRCPDCGTDINCRGV